MPACAGITVAYIFISYQRKNYSALALPWVLEIDIHRIKWFNFTPGEAKNIFTNSLMDKQPEHTRYTVKCLVAAVVFLFASKYAHSQNATTSDSSKLKKQTTAATDTSKKYGYGRLVLLGHVRDVPLQPLPDSDGDGVPDQFDFEPNTPQGVAVDSHGRALDTDGDGVPDYKDKEKLTLPKCFPVDSNGVGTCPQPACCKEVRKTLIDNEEYSCCATMPCELASLPSVKFKKRSYMLTQDAIGLLTNAGKELRASPHCRLRVVGYSDGTFSDLALAEQLSWDRVNEVIKYLIEQEGFSENRFIFVYGQKGKTDLVDLIPITYTETGSSVVPPPIPRHK